MLIRYVQRAGLIIGAILAAVLFFLGGAALRLLMGPISLGPFASVIEDALNHSVAGVVIRFDQAVIEWSRPEGKINLIVLGTKVFDVNGHIIAQAPKADLDFDAAGMVQGKLNLKRFGLIGVQLTGIRDKTGAIRLGFGPEEGEPDLFKTIRNILQNSAAGGGSLDSFAIRNARLAFRDEPTGLFVVAPDINFTLDDKGKTFDVSLDAAVEISGIPARLSAKATLREDGSPDHGTLAIKGLSLPALVQNSARFASLKPYRLSSDLEASFAFDRDGMFTSTDFHVAGAGTVDTAVFKTPLKLDKFETTGHFDAAGSHLALADFTFATKEIAAKVKADLQLGWKEDELASVNGDIAAADFRLDMPDWFYQPLAFSNISIQGAYDLGARTFTWQRAVLDGGAFVADTKGEAHFAGGGSPALSVAGTINALPVDEALKYWPVGVGPGARDWIKENIPGGRVGPVRVETDFPAGALDQDRLPDSSMTLTFPFEGMSARYIPGMTPVTAARGEARLTGDSFHLTVAAASVGPLAVSEGDVAIPDLHTHGVIGHIKAHSEGKVSEVLDLIDEQPLGYAKRFGLKPETVSGRAAVDLDVDLPLLRDISFDQIRIGVQAKASDVALPLDNRKLDHAQASFTIDNKSLTAQGNANLQTVPIVFKWTEDFLAEGITTRVDVAGRLDEQSRASLGLSEPKWISGPMPASLALTGRRFHFSDGALKADLTGAAVDLPVLNLAKRAGTRTNATAQLHFGEAGAVTISDLVVTGESLNAKGGLSLDKDGKIVNVSFGEVRSGINDFALDLAPTVGDGLDVRIHGKSLDGAHYFTDKKKTPNATAPADADDDLQHPLSLNIKVDRLVLHDAVNLKDVSLALALAPKDRINGFTLDAMGTGKGKITGHMEVVKGVRNLTLDTDDAGALIDTFMSFSSVRGGKLSAKISFPADLPGPANVKTPLADYQGTVTLSDIVVTDQPFVARLFSAGSLDGPLRLLQGSGIPLSTVSVPFNARGKVVTIHEGRAAGPAIGATFEGMLDRKTEKVDVTGTLVPLYGLNSFLGAVPLLGDILISKKGEGIFGLTYAMKGNLNEPALSVNPLSVLTPGIFRRIFEYATPKAPPPEIPPPPQASAESKQAAPAPTPN